MPVQLCKTQTVHDMYLGSITVLHSYLIVEFVNGVS